MWSKFKKFIKALKKDGVRFTRTRTDIYTPHKWFAWYPVVTSDRMFTTKYVWLTTVKRHYCYQGWIYREV